MKQVHFVLLAALLLPVPVFAQTDNPYNGKWTVMFDGKKSIDLEGAVVIKDDGGTWDMVAQARKNPCVGRAHPITVKKASADELVITVNRAQTLTGCKDSTYTFKRVDDKTIRGDMADGREISLVRN
jgi:hypothetical protein